MSQDLLETRTSFRSLLVGLVPSNIRLRKRAVQAWTSGERELRLLPILCRSNESAIDVGANSGVYTFYLHKYSSHAIAVEANPKYASFIKSALPRASVIEGAASDHAGKAILRIPRDLPSDGMATVEPANFLGNARSDTIEVRLLTLNSLNLPKTGFIKVDVEGHELAVLLGAMSLIERYRPNILIEAEERHRPNAVGSVVDVLRARGYSGFFLSGGKMVPIEQFDVATHQDVRELADAFLLGDEKTPGAKHISHDALQGAKPPGDGGHGRYINNFVFVHRSEARTIAQLLAFRNSARH